MTKQHFIAVAVELNNSLRNAWEEDSREGGEPNRQRGVKSAIHAFCNAAARFNPRFDRARFLSACGIGS